MPGTQERFVRMQALRDWSLLALVILVPAAIWPTIIGFMHVALPASEAYESCSVARQAAEVWDGSDGLEVRTTVVPLSRLCSWDDGYTRDLVPGWVNPVLGSFAAAFSLAIVGTITGTVMSRRSRSDA